MWDDEEWEEVEEEKVEEKVCCCRFFFSFSFAMENGEELIWNEREEELMRMY